MESNNESEKDRVVNAKALREIEAIRSAMQSSRFAIVFSSISSIVAVLGLVIGQYNIYHQKKFDVSVRENERMYVRLNSELVRMLEIAKEVDILFGESYVLASRAFEERAKTKEAIESLSKSVFKIKYKAKTVDAAWISESIASLSRLTKNLTDEWFVYDMYMPIVTSAEKWNGKWIIPTPDFEIIFADNDGHKDILEKWNNVCKSAKALLRKKEATLKMAEARQHKYRVIVQKPIDEEDSMFASDDEIIKERLESFDRDISIFQARMYQIIYDKRQELASLSLKLQESLK